MPLPTQSRIDPNRGARGDRAHLSSAWVSARYTRGACRLSRRVSADQRAVGSVGGPCRQLRRRLAERRRDLLDRPRDRLTGVAALHRRWARHVHQHPDRRLDDVAVPTSSRQRSGRGIGGIGDPEVARPSGAPGRGLVKGHEELRLAVGKRPGAGPLGEQLTLAGPGSTATENRTGRLVQRYVPPHGPGHQNALQGRGAVPPGTSDQPPDPGPGSSPSVLVRQRHLASIVMGPQGVLPLSCPRQPRAALTRARAAALLRGTNTFHGTAACPHATAVGLTRSVTVPTIVAIRSWPSGRGENGALPSLAVSRAAATRPAGAAGPQPRNAPRSTGCPSAMLAAARSTHSSGMTAAPPSTTAAPILVAFGVSVGL